MQVLGKMPLAPSRQIPMRNSFLGQVFEASQVLAQEWGFDASFLPIVGSLVAALILITLFISLLVWLRYLVVAGLITTCIVAGVRRKKKVVRGPILGDGHGMISHDEHGLEMEEPD